MISGLQLSAVSKSMSQTVTLSVKNKSMFEVLQSIRQQTGYVSFSSEALFKQAKPITLRVKDTPLEETLNLVFRDQPLSYTLAGKTILITPRQVNKRGVRAVPH